MRHLVRSCIYTDESGITTVQNPSRILACKGRKQVVRVVSGERFNNYRCVCACHECGRAVHTPVLLFKRKKMNDRLMENRGCNRTAVTYWFHRLPTDLAVRAALHQVCTAV